VCANHPPVYYQYVLGWRPRSVFGHFCASQMSPDVPHLFLQIVGILCKVSKGCQGFRADTEYGCPVITSSLHAVLRIGVCRESMQCLLWSLLFVKQSVGVCIDAIWM
jgi:hypothetical protein